MKIQGNLATYEFSDLLQWLAQGNKTGVLTVSDGETQYNLGFDHGRIDMSSSSDPQHRLDTYLHRKGIIDAATLERAERLRDATQMMSGQVLVTLGAVSDTQLAQALREKTEEILCELLTWDEGSFEFEGGDRPETTMVPISLEVTKLLLESMHRLDEQQRAERAETPAAAKAPVEAAPAAPQPSPDATQAIDGLALAEVMDPEPVATPASPAPVELPAEEPTADLPPYVAMAQSRSGARRLLPYAVVALLVIGAAGFYLANMGASAQAGDVGPSGPPILFTQTAGPEISPDGAPAAEPVAAAAPSPTAAERVREAEGERVLRQRYEEELAGLRKELEEARRQVRPATTEPLTPALGSQIAAGEPPVDSILRAAVSPPATIPEPAVAEPLPRPSPPAEASGPAERPVAKPEAEPPAAAVVEPEPEPEPAIAAPSLTLEKPVLVTRLAPRYPPGAKRLGRGATVTIRLLIGADGNVEKIERVGDKAGMGFDRAAEDAARKSTWRSGTRDGKPTLMWTELRFDFKP